jgi:hypothetical protein
MADPAGELATLIEGIDDLPDGFNVYAAPSEKITAPAAVIRPDAPWLIPSKFCNDEERYAVVVVVTANTPSDGVAMLRSVLLQIIEALTSPWDWEQADAPLIDETTGVPFLVARLRLKYLNGGPE